ncbi:hypothetical protein WDJ50_01265 [Deinococcus sp. VB142]|uniref:hypothetical protein n=1 Tax=Deinococcus sp. VB142 TaxID=3112952 RepID=UPI0030D438B7
MKLRQPTAGAAVILVVLLTLLLLAGILSASLRLSLSSRQNTADQTAALGAQYAAESQVALAESRFRDIQRLLTNKVRAPAGYEVRHLAVAPTTTVPDMESYARKFCGKATVSNPWQATDAFAEPRDNRDSGQFPEAQECVVDASSRLSEEQFSILSAAVTPDAYHVLPASERPRPDANLNEWWSRQLSLSSDNLSYQIVPLRVVKLTPLRYRFYLGVKEFQARGVQGRAERLVRGQRSVGGDWWFEFYMPTPLDYNIFVQSMPPTNGGLAYSVIDGDMYVAEHVRFLTSANSVKFLGNLNTSGCTPLPPAYAAPDADCERTPGFYDSDSVTLNNIAPDGLDSIALNRNLTDRVLRTGATFAPGKRGTFDARYIGLPQSVNQQAALAQASGIVLASDETHIELLAGDAAGRPLSNYDQTNQAWEEPEPTYQYIRLSKPGVRYDTTRWIEYSTDPSVYNQTPPEHRESYGCTIASQGSYVFTCYRVRPSISENVVTREYRYGPDKVLYGKDAAGDWQAVLQNFNGVVYSSGTPTVRGPARLGNDTTGALDKMPPAVASFANLGVVSAEGMRLDTDLTVSDVPCANGRQPGSTVAAPQPCQKTGDRTPRNMLGLYTPSGDIVMTTKTPNEATYHATIMASNGSFRVEQSRERAPQGHRHVVGSVISKVFGLNGVADLTGRGVTAGYSDAFSYDTRLRDGLRPNGILITEVWLASDNADTGKRLSDVSWRQSRARSQ